MDDAVLTTAYDRQRRDAAHPLITHCEAENNHGYTLNVCPLYRLGSSYLAIALLMPSSL